MSDPVTGTTVAAGGLMGASLFGLATGIDYGVVFGAFAGAVFYVATAVNISRLKQPELLAEDVYAARSAAWFFSTKGCLKFSGDVVQVTKIINGGTNGLEDRRARFAKAKTVLV